MQPLSRCTGDIINWVQYTFRDNDGSANNRRQCAEACTRWARDSHDAWCCNLTEDWTSGTSRSCAAHTGLGITGYSHQYSQGSYAVVGRCQ